jgi:hypothetical protein
VLLLIMALRSVVSNVRLYARGRGGLLVDGVRELHIALSAGALGAMEGPQLTYAGHCDDIYGAREAAETDVVVLLRVRLGLEVASSPGENRWAGHGISAAAIGQSRLPLLQLLLPTTKHKTFSTATN